MCRGKQNREDAKRGWKIDGWEVEIWETVRRIGKLDLRMRKKMLNRRANRGENHIWCKGGVVVTENGMVWSQGRKKDQKSVRVTCIADGCDNGRVEKDKKSWRLTFFCLPLFSAGSQQVWVWTAGKQIDVSFYSQTTLLHLWQPPRWRDRPMGWKMKEAKQKCTKARGQKSGGVQGH